tara:strand:+ start:3172 stop:3432 length:261 start_codon:yes stop_codon:yes gene_type:complete
VKSYIPCNLVRGFAVGLLALVAEAKEIQLVRGNDELVVGCHFFLKLLDQRVVELNDLAAFRTDHVVVVAMHVSVFIALLSVPKIEL